LPLLLLLLVLSTASATHSPETASARTHHHHHRSPFGTATAHFHPVPAAAPSMHQNYLHADTQSLLSAVEVDPVLADAQATDAAEARPAPLLPPQAAAATPDLAEATPQPQEEGPEPTTPAAATTSTLLPLPATVATTASPPPHPAVSDAEQGLQQLARVLTSLGYNEMASEAPLLARAPPLARWPGAITVFAAPDAFLQASCPMCSRRHLLEQHIAMGYYPYSDLAAAATMKIPSASVGFCIKVATQRGPFGIHYARIYADGVEVSHPELYNDGRYIIHGLHGFLRPLTHSCFDGPHQHHLNARSAPASSAATAASVVRIMIHDAMARLRDGGYEFMAMPVKFAELEKFANLTLFTLDDPAIFVGGGHDYVSAVRFHIVPNHRLTSADLHRLRPGTVLPTLAGEGQSLVVTHYATDSASSKSNDVCINYIPIKEPDVVVNSRIAVHGVYVPFPRLHLADLAASVAVASATDTCGAGGPFGNCASSASAIT
uniref:FAS1 domain-containing protein n=1 Tax=Aegilops tauschii subsp. strangulata TaxID=200361 RepID=A0A453JLJ2_AEGTS